MKIYPNPSNGWATIDLENVNYPVELIIYNSYGAEINKVKIANSQASKLDINNLNKGIYFVKIKTISYSEVTKLVVK